jgi:hypothetical protein
LPSKNRRAPNSLLSLLAQRALQNKKLTDAATWLQKALEGEPSSGELRVALARTAMGDATKIIAIRDDFLRALPRTPDSLRRAAAMARLAKQNDQSAKLLSQALLLAQVSRTSLDQTGDIALLAARSFFATGQEARAQEIWSGFAATLPHASTQKDELPAGYWPFTTRLAALMDQEKLLRLAGRAAEADRIAALGNAMFPSQADINAAQAYLAGLE